MSLVEHEQSGAQGDGNLPRGSAELVSFVPRLTLEWLRDNPERRWLEVEGTLAFIDISGFTAMSEKLSSLGRAGAEEVTDVMNATFSALLQVAYEQGGGLLKFGGDALLLLYDGENHARRAARAAFEMRRTLRAIGRPRTSAGAVQLKMHAGLNSGRFHFFLVGESHRELLVTGPAATRTVEMEAASEAGEILLSPETVALLDAEVLGDEKGPGHLLQAAPEAQRAVAPLPEVEGIPLELAVPAPLRAQLLEVGPLEGEHRHASIAFLRFSGIDEIIATEGPESAAEALDVLVKTIQHAADDHKVTFLESDVDKDGGRIILVSGAPQTFGDDEERLLRTVRAVVDAGMPLPLHIGVSEGRVFTGQVGAPFRRTYTVLGDTAALAARLMARAPEDEIWVSGSAFARGGGSFESTELEPFQVKGKSEPVQAVVLGELVREAEQPQAEAGEAPEELPFVDRERERAVLAASVAPVRMGFGSLVELVGEPGIGKSRLAQELRENCTDMRQINLRCQEYEASTPYYPFRPFLRSLLDVELNGGGEHNRTVLAERLGAVDEELIPWTPLLGAPLDVEVEPTPEVKSLDPSFWRARLHGVMGTLLGHLLDSPTLLVFDDVHWMDDASSELLRYLGTQLPTKPWLTCTTRRPIEGGFAAAEGTPPLPALTLRLEPLPEEDAKKLAQAAAGDRPLTDEELAALMERGAGNPLFLQRLASVGEAAEDGEELPETVEALLATRIDKLAPGDRALLRWASVLGVSFSGSLILDVLEGDSLVAAASEAWERLGEFVERDPDVPGAFRFRHALIRDAAYEGLSFKRRRELHGRVAEVVEKNQGERPEEAAELLSLHFYRAERWPDTWRYSVEAARRAEEKYANVEVATFLERALEVVDRLPDVAAEEVARVWEELGDARLRLAHYEQAAAAYRSARTTGTPDPVEEARLMQQEAMVPVRLGRYPEALEHLTEALDLLQDLEGDAASAQRARLSSWLGTVFQWQRRSDDAIDWCRRGIAEGESSGAEDAVAQAYFILDWAYASLGRRDEAVYSTRALEIYERLGNLDRVASVLNNLGAHAYLDGHWDKALAFFGQARETYEKIGDETEGAWAAANIAEISSDQGRLEVAEPLFRMVLEVRRAAGNPLELARVASLLGTNATRLGNLEEARTLLEEARGLYASEGEDTELLTADARLVECLVFARASSEALLLAQQALQRADQMTGVSVVAAYIHRLRGWAYMQTGDVEAARAALEESLRVARLEEENYGARSADYEIGLTLAALVRLHELAGETANKVRTERDALLDGLGVVKVPEPPLPHDTRGSDGSRYPEGTSS
jgi:class 3 adenylate cyclase/tetratricopeptide (TPR) repeat protein